ncbi:putative RNA-binding protein Luc7-like 2 isoform X2 [Rhopilema esculentum]
MGLCPYEQFHNTKLDLGPCHKYHSLALKADFENASKAKDYGYDVDQLEHLTSFVKDCDRKVEVNKKRLEDNSEDYDGSPEAMAVHALNERIGKLLAESETLGADGKVEESLAMMKEVDDLKVQKRKAEDMYRSTLPVTTSQQQKLRVCEICGAYLSLYDNDRRLADHFGGKLHMGFIKIRERLAELQESVAAKREAREKEREQRRKEREERLEKEKKERSRERDRRKRSRSRSREGSRRRDRSRDRRRDRSRSRDRSRDKDRRRRDRDSRDGRDRRRERSRDRNRARSKSRERSRERRRSRDRNGSRQKSRERSRDKSRDRSRERSKNRSRDGSRERSRNQENLKEDEVSKAVGKTSEAKEDGEIDSAVECTNDVTLEKDQNMANEHSIEANVA